MRMLSEHVNEDFARKLEKLLLSASKDSKWSDVRSAVKGFAKSEIYPQYLKHSDKADCKDLPNPEIKKLFE